MSSRKLEELSLKRVLKGIVRRIMNIPHKISWNFSQTALNNREKLTKYKNIHLGQRCFLIANGPSLNKTDINLLKDEITFGLNRIYLNYSNMSFKPNYLVCINKLVLNQFANEFKNETMPEFFNWQCREKFKNQNNINFLEMNFFSSEFSKDISKSITSAATVTYAALQIIYYMGFKEVVVIGMDHNFFFTGKPNEIQRRTEEKDVNHFSPNYFPKGLKWETPDLTATEYFYKVAKQIYEKDDRKIFDATIEGKCDVFDKKELKSFFVE